MSESERSKPTRDETRFLVAGATRCILSDCRREIFIKKPFGSPQTKRAEPSS
jgi:hypothetical protein